MIDTRPLLVGGALAEIFQVPQKALDAFYDSLCAGAQNYMGRWKVLPDRLDALQQDNIIEHNPTSRHSRRAAHSRVRAYYTSPGQQVRDLIAATSRKNKLQGGV